MKCTKDGLEMDFNETEAENLIKNDGWKPVEDDQDDQDKSIIPVNDGDDIDN